MFNRIIGILTGNQEKSRQTADTAAPAHEQAFARLNQVAPLAQTSPDPPTQDSAPHSVVCREAVLNRAQRVAGYSFMLRRPVNQRVRNASSLVQHLYDEVLLRNILAMGIQRLLGHRLAFIPVLPSSLDHPLLEQLPRTGTVFVVGATEQLAANSDAMLARLGALKAFGYRIALQGEHADMPAMLPFLELAEFIFIDPRFPISPRFLMEAIRATA